LILAKQHSLTHPLTHSNSLIHACVHLTQVTNTLRTLPTGKPMHSNNDMDPPSGSKYYTTQHTTPTHASDPVSSTHPIFSHPISPHPSLITSNHLLLTHYIHSLLSFPSFSALIHLSPSALRYRYIADRLTIRFTW
jgi:hypothetical protein